MHALEIQILSATIGGLGLMATLAVYLNASAVMRRSVAR